MHFKAIMYNIKAIMYNISAGRNVFFIAKPSRILYNVEGPVLPDLKNVASVTWKFLLILLDLKTYWSFLVIVKRRPDPTCGV